MSINRRHLLTGLAVAVPTTAIASNADATHSEAELFRLEAEFNEADILWQAVSVRTDQVEDKTGSLICVGRSESGSNMRSRWRPRLSYHGHACTYAGRNPAEIACG